MNNTAHNQFKKGDKVRVIKTGREYSFVEYMDASYAKLQYGIQTYDFCIEDLELVVPVSKTPRTDAAWADIKCNVRIHAEQLETELAAMTAVAETYRTELDAKSGIVDALEEELEKTKNALARADHDRHVNADLHERAIVDRDDAVSIRDEWAEKAKYYHGLLEQCGYALGREAYTYADGTLQSDVIVAKVPELVRELAEARKRLIEELNRQKLSNPEPDYARQAKDIIHRQFGAESPFRKIDLDNFVDLIIKAAKA